MSSTPHATALTEGYQEIGFSGVNGLVAQLVRARSRKQQVVGSNRTQAQCNFSSEELHWVSHGVVSRGSRTKSPRTKSP